MENDKLIASVPITKLDELTEAVIHTKNNVNFIKEDMLPPIIEDVREARDNARSALNKIKDHVYNISIHDHKCVENERQLRQDNDIDIVKSGVVEVRTQSSNTSKIVWWIMSIAITIAVTACAFAMTISVDTSSNKVHIENNNIEIKELRKSQQQDRELYLKEVKELFNRIELISR